MSYNKLCLATTTKEFIWEREQCYTLKVELTMMKASLHNTSCFILELKEAISRICIRKNNKEVYILIDRGLVFLPADI